MEYYSLNNFDDEGLDLSNINSQMRVSNHSKKITTNAAHFGQKDSVLKQGGQNQIKIQITRPKEKDDEEMGYLLNSFISLHYKESDIPIPYNNQEDGSNQYDARESIINIKQTGNAIAKDVAFNFDNSQTVNNEGSKHQYAGIRNSNSSFITKRSQYKKEELNNKGIPPSSQKLLISPPTLLTRNLSSQVNKPQFIENSKLLMDVSNFSCQDKEQPIDIDSVCRKAEPAFQKKELEFTVTELRKTGRLCESFVDIGNKFEEKKSNSKMKLRDYLYMTQTSSKKASLQKHELIQKRKSPTSSLITQTASHVYSSAPKQIHSPSPQSSYISRQSATPKYQLSNGRMFQILKKQLCQSLHSIHENLNKVQEELLDVESFDKQPTNQQLLVLCTMRREIKEQVQKRVVKTLESLVKSKRSNLLQSRSKRQNTTVNKPDINFDQFSRNCI